MEVDAVVMVEVLLGEVVRGGGDDDIAIGGILEGGGGGGGAGRSPTPGWKGKDGGGVERKFGPKWGPLERRCGGAGRMHGRPTYADVGSSGGGSDISAALEELGMQPLVRGAPPPLPGHGSRGGLWSPPSPLCMLDDAEVRTLEDDASLPGGASPRLGRRGGLIMWETPPPLAQSMARLAFLELRPEMLLKLEALLSS